LNDPIPEVTGIFCISWRYDVFLYRTN